MKRILLVLAITLCALAWSYRSTPVSATMKPKTAVTFTKEIAPIFFKSCAECHRPGEAAPFSVLSYKDVRPWAKSIREKVVSREMPPWHADPHVGQWMNDRRLSQKEIDTITAWVDGGVTEGNAKDLPPMPKFADGWAHGKPDVVLQMAEEYTLAASGPDEYQYFFVPTNFTEDKFISFAEVRPGNRQVVHHIVVSVLPPGSQYSEKTTTTEYYKIQEKTPNPFTYLDGLVNRLRMDAPVHNDLDSQPKEIRVYNNFEGKLTIYAPGSNYGVWEPGAAMKIAAGSLLRLQVHYSKIAGSVQKDRSMVGLTFAKAPPKKLVLQRTVGNAFFLIPPYAERHKVTSYWIPKNDVTIQGFWPHMHYRGAAMEYRVTYPNGKTESLLNVPIFKFDWQTYYVSVKPVKIPRGSRIDVTAYFDNSTRNKANPDPTKAVRLGDPSYDEMMLGVLDYAVDKPATVAMIPAATFAQYAGQYQYSQNRTATIYQESGQYFAQISSSHKYELLPITVDKFLLPGADATVTFAKNEQGERMIVLENNDGIARYKKLGDSLTKEIK